MIQSISYHGGGNVMAWACLVANRMLTEVERLILRHIGLPAHSQNAKKLLGCW